MNTKYSILSLFLSFFCLTIQAQTKTITSSDVISVTTEYVDNVSMTWYVNGTVTNRPLLINYSIGTEYRYDFVKIYSIDSNNVETLLVSLSGLQSGSISSVIPTGKVKITFNSDVGVNNQSYPTICTGLYMTFSTDTSYPSSTIANNYVSGNSIVNGNVGIGVLNPSYKLEVNGTAKFYENVQCGNSISFIDNARFWVYNTNVPTLRPSVPQYSMPQYGIAAPLTNGSADLWLSGNGGIRMFTAGNPNPAVNVLTNGNVGIGSLTPSEKLEVYNSDVTPGVISLMSNRNDLTHVDVGRVSAKQGTTEVARIGLPRAEDTSSGYFTFWTKANNASALTEKVRINAAGYVGIGTTNPLSKLDVQAAPNQHVQILQDVNGALSGCVGIVSINDGNTGYTPLGFYASKYYFGNGNVGIGSTNPDARLTVNGTIHATEVKVDVNVPADFVFDATYNLKPLSEVELYVNANKHLPEIPSASEITKNGMNMGEMQNKLLQKVEELTLYMIQQQKTINQQSAKIEELENKLQK